MLGFLVCFGLVSAGFFDSIDNGVDASCSDLLDILGDEYLGYSIPDNVPFSNEVLNFYVDEEFFVSMVLINKQVESVSCDLIEDFGYSVFVSRGLFLEVENLSGSDFVDFYNEKRDSGELRVEAAGFGGKVKLGLIDLGLKIAGWFS